MDDLVLVGDRVLDLSPRGAMIACDEEMAIGQELMISLRGPWLGPHVVVLGIVTRVIEGWREGDPGYCVGVSFIDLEEEVRRDFTERLVHLPVIASTRRYPADYAENVRRIAAGF